MPWFSRVARAAVLASISSYALPEAGPLEPADLAIAGVTFGADTASVRARLGTPRSASQEDWKYPGIRVQLDSGRVSMLHITSSRWPTRRGIKVGSSIVALHRAYGQSTWTTSQQIGYVLQPDTSYLHLGLSFEIKNGHVSYILSGIVAVTVH